MSVHLSMFNASGLSANNVFPSKGKQKFGTEASQSLQLTRRHENAMIRELIARVEGANCRKLRSKKNIRERQPRVEEELTLFEFPDNAVDTSKQGAGIHRRRTAGDNHSSKASWGAVRIHRTQTHKNLSLMRNQALSIEQLKFGL